MISENSLDGHILEVDPEYPDELHELHNDYPLAPENLKLVIICCQNIAVVLQIIMTKIGSVNKLVPSLGELVELVELV